MTVTEITRQHTSAWRAFFRDLALDVARGGQTHLVGYLVARRIATGCADPNATFDRLIEATRDLIAYTMSREAEGDWLDAHHLKHDDESRQDYLVVIEERIEHALDDLMTGAAA